MKQLLGRMVEKSLQAELSEHIGYGADDTRRGENARNGTTFGLC